MGQTCCSYYSKDPNAIAMENNPNAVKLQASTKLVIKDLSPEAKQTLTVASKNIPKVVKIQALIRGFLTRKNNSPSKKKIVSGRKNENKKVTEKKEQKPSKDKNARDDHDVEAKLSQRSGGGRFKGGGMPERKQDSYRNGIVYAK